MLGKKLGFLTATLLSAAMLWGCGSSGSGGSDVRPAPSLDDLQRVGSGSCKTCHSLAHNTFNPLVGQASPNALIIVHDCEDCHGGGQAHRGTPGTLPHPRPDLARCATAECHPGPVEGMEQSIVHLRDSGAPNCLACHEPLTFAKQPKISCSECHGELDPADIAKKPFSDEIFARFSGSPHTSSQRNDPRSGTCALCHSHEGAVAYLSHPEKINTIGGVTEFAALSDVTDIAGADLNFINCATCHDPHSGTLRGVGVQSETVQLNTGASAEKVVYSAEFNLCTSCHQVNLNATWNPDFGYAHTSGTLPGAFEYELSEAYLKENNQYGVQGATADTSGLGYHNNSYQSRSFVDTHFGGKISKELYYYDIRGGIADARPSDYASKTDAEKAAIDAVLQAAYDAYQAAADDIAIAGYNVNPASANACSACHDVHSANKIVAAGNQLSRRGLNNEPFLATAIAYAEGIGMTHGNYMNEPFLRAADAAGALYASANCTPCHNGRDFVKMTKGAARADLGGPVWNPVACISCHDMAVENGVNLRAARTYPTGTEFKFNSGTDATLAARNQLCFECHKGRDGLKTNHATTTQVYEVNYLHYSPTFATNRGAVGMIPTYAGRDYNRTWAGHSQHSAATQNNDCFYCHRVHVEYGSAANEVGNGFVADLNSKSTFTPTSLQTDLCGSCHYESRTEQNNYWRSFNVLRARTKVFGDVLFETILGELRAMYNDGVDFQLPENLNAADQVRAKKDLLVIFEGIDSPKLTGDLALATTGAFLTSPNRTERVAFEQAFEGVDDKEKARLKVYITGATRDATGSRLVTNNLAKAAAVWKNYMYDDKGGWAHNSIFARQLMYDAIENLNPAKLVDLRVKAAEYGVPVVRPAGTNNDNGLLMRYLNTGATVRPLPELPVEE